MRGSRLPAVAPAAVLLQLPLPLSSFILQGEVLIKGEPRHGLISDDDTSDKLKVGLVFQVRRGEGGEGSAGCWDWRWGWQQACSCESGSFLPAGGRYPPPFPPTRVAPLRTERRAV